MKYSQRLILLAVGIAISLSAQSANAECPPAYVFTGEAAADQFGWSLSGAGDVNNDGFDDLIVGAPFNDAGGGEAGRAYVYSGQSGTRLYTFTGEGPFDRFGISVSGAGDVNNDGYDDLIVGAPFVGGNVGRAYVYSGQSGALLHTFTGEAVMDDFGISVSSAGDVNDDGFDDVIVGATRGGGGNAGRAYVYSGQGGALLHTFTGEAAEDRFGYSVSGAGDVNNDGFDDLIVGANYNNAGGARAGRAYVYSGQSGALLYTFTGETAYDLFGESVSGAGDVNNDGYDDLIVGAAGNDAGGSNAGRAYVYSGQSGALLYTFTGEAAGDQFGRSVSGAGDVNNDGFDDLIVGAYFNDAGGGFAGRAYVYTCESGFCDGFDGLFCDDFEDEVITDWQVLAGSCTWSESDGILSTSDPCTEPCMEQWCIQTVGDQSWDNYVFEAKVRGNSGVDKVLVFRVQDANNYYAVNLRSDYPTPGIDQLTFDKMENGVYNADIATADYSSENGVWYHLKVACADNSFKVYVADILVLEHTDNDNPYYTGGIGVACWTGLEGNCDISFDDVAVTYPTTPHIHLNPTELSFEATQNGPLPTPQTLVISNVCGGTLDWYIDEQISWLDIDPYYGTSNYQEITVSINTTSLDPGTYNEVMTVTSSNADNSPQTVMVELNITAGPHIELYPTSLTFEAVEGGSNPADQTFTITNTGGGTLDWSVSDDQAWLAVNPTSGVSNSAVIDVFVDISGLTAGTYNTTITVASANADNSPQTVTVALNITTGPHIELNPTDLSFTAAQYGTLPDDQMFTINNTGGGTLDWYVDEQISWLDIDPYYGTSNYQEITVTINTTSLDPGTYNEVMTVTSSNADNSPQVVSVTYQVYNPDGTPAELAQYDFIKDRLENLKIDLFPGFNIPVVNNYEMEDANSFVDNVIRPGYPTEIQLETFQRLLMAVKIVNAGYRYMPDVADPLPETDEVRGAEELWDLGSKNTVTAVISGVTLLTLFDKMGSKLFSKLIKKAVNLILDALTQLKRLIPNEDARRTFDAIATALKGVVSATLTEGNCVICILTQPPVRVALDEIAISSFHVPKTQEALDNAGDWSTTYSYTNDLASAETMFQQRWTAIKNITDQSIVLIVQYEEHVDAAELANDLQELWDAVADGPWEVLKKAVKLIGKLLGIQDVWWSIKAAGEAIATASTIPHEVVWGTYDIFYSDKMEAPYSAEGAIRGNLNPWREETTSGSNKSIPIELEAYNEHSLSLIAAIQSSDSVMIFEEAESLLVAIDDVTELFQLYSYELTSRADSAWTQFPGFDTVLATADAATTRAQLCLAQSYFIALGVQWNPYDSEFNSMSITALDSATVDLEQSWWTVDSVQQLLSGVPAVPTLILIPEQDYFIVSRDSQFVINYVVTNIGDDSAVGVYARAFQVEGITIHSTDSITLADISPGDSIPISFSVSLDSVADPTTYYQTSLFDVAAYASNGTGSQVTVIVTAPTYWCGDVDASGAVNVADLTYLVDYLFFEGSPPPVMEAANVDGEGGINVADLTYLVDYLFFGGPDPICGPIE